MARVSRAIKVQVGGELRTQEDVNRFFRQGLFEASNEVLRRENQVERKRSPPNLPSTVVVFPLRGKPQNRRIPTREARTIGSLPAGGLQIEPAQYRKVEFRYATKTDVVAAAVYVFQQLRTLLPKQSGHGTGSVYFWVKNAERRGQSFGKYKSITAFKSKARELDAKGVVYSVNVVGPTVPYRRQLIYGTPKGKLTRSETSRLVRRSAATSKYLQGVNVSRLVGYRKGNNLLQNFEAARVERQTKAGKKLVRYRVRRAVQTLIVNRARSQFPQVAMGYFSLPARPAPVGGSGNQPDRRTGKRWPNDAKPRLLGRADGYLPAVYITGAVRVDDD